MTECRPDIRRDHLPGGGPMIIAPGLWAPGGNPGNLLTPEEQALLTVIATVVRFKKGETIYREGEPATAVFNIISGVLKTHSDQPGHNRHIVGFWFSFDLVGLAENGNYSNSAEAVTDVTAYRIPAVALQTRLRKHPGLDFQIIAKLCHDLRQSQRHAILLSRRSAIAKTGFFIQMLEVAQADRDEDTAEVYLPMSRLDIAAYIAISPEAVSRALRELAGRGAIAMRDRQHVKIIDRERLEAAVAAS